MRKGGFAALLGATILVVLAGCTAPVPENVSVSGVNLSATGIGLVVGETKSLAATVLPSDATDKGVSWTSDDYTIASVDKNGVVTGVKEGSTAIVVTTDDKGFTASCGVLVGAFHVESVNFETSTISLKTNDEYQLVWTVLPEYASDKDVTFASSDTNIVTFVNGAPGKIFAKAAGSATITVTTNDRSKTATCTVVVTP